MLFQLKKYIFGENRHKMMGRMWNGGKHHTITITVRTFRCYYFSSIQKLKTRQNKTKDKPF